MNTIFIGGSRHVSRLPAEISQRLDNVVASNHRVVIGDANGADKATQRHLTGMDYRDVVIFCSGDVPRNNLGGWPTRPITAPLGARGFRFHAAKDRAMADEADFGLMIWDGRSPGTMLNIVRLAQAGKIAVLFDMPARTAITVKSLDQCRDLLLRHDPDLRASLKERATPEEWQAIEPDAQPSLLDHVPADAPEPIHRKAPAAAAAIDALNDALATNDAVRAVEVIGAIARAHGMTSVARTTGLARESLYRALDAGGNPEFMTIMRVLGVLGVKLGATTHESDAHRHALAR